MTDNEIIKYMQCVIGKEMLCSECTYQKVLPFPSCRMMCAKNAIDLINRLQDEKQALINGQETLQNTIVEQKAEIERLKNNIDGLNIFTTNHMKIIRLQAVKEFAERLKCGVPQETGVIRCADVDNLVKEMTEVNENE